MQTLETQPFITQLPPSLTGDSQVKALAPALDGELQALPALAMSTVILPAIAAQPEAVLDVLAVHLAVINYQQSFPLAVKQQLVSQSLMTHRQLGTAAAIQRVVAAIYGAGVMSLQEWNDYGGAPYHFRVIGPESVLTQAQQPQLLIDQIALVKNARSIMDAVVTTSAQSGSVYIGCAVCIGTIMTLTQE